MKIYPAFNEFNNEKSLQPTGDKIPWNVGLKNFSVYSVHHQSDSPWRALQLLKPTTVMSTVGVSYKYQPPTSDDISALGLCLHTDMHNVTGSISPQQVCKILSIYSSVHMSVNNSH